MNDAQMRHKKYSLGIFLGKLFLVCCICWGVVHTAVIVFRKDSQSTLHPAQASRKSPTRPFSEDQYSGKTVSNSEMALQLMLHRKSNAPRVGELAPEFSLKTASGDREVSLAELRQNKPLVLIMASWGCDVFRETVPGILWLHSKYKDQANFVMVYIREAHSLSGVDAALARVNDPTTTRQRMVTAEVCKQQLKLPFPLLVDSIDDPVMTRWAAWPVRIYVVGTDGKLVYSGGQGPWGYRPYRGYQHGAGRQLKRDQQFNTESLQEFFETQFPPKSLDKSKPIDGSKKK